MSSFSSPFRLNITAAIMLFFVYYSSHAQLNIDTLAIQDFETSPASPVWTFTGPVVYNSGNSSASAAPPNSPIGINGSRAWETTTNSGGLVLEFANITIPAGYDSIRMHYNLAAMNLNSSSGGPDNLDYVLTEVSTNGGSSYYARLRIRGATSNNCFWPYSATGFAQLYYQPAIEVTFNPTSSGLQTTFGYSNCEIVFPGSVTQVRVRITGRSSSSTDTWLIDNVVLTGEKICSNSTASVTTAACDSFIAPSGQVFNTTGTFTDVIPNASGCDSIINLNLTIDNIDPAVTINGTTITATETGAAYQWLDCDNGMAAIAGETARSYTAGANGNYAVAIVKGACLDTSTCAAITSIDTSTVGITKAQFSQVISAVPNPTSGAFTILTEKQLNNVSLKIYDMLGKCIIYEMNVGNGPVKLDLSSYKNGMYLVELTSGNEIKRMKVMKR